MDINQINIKDVLSNFFGIFSFPIRELPEELIETKKDIISLKINTIYEDKLNMKNDFRRFNKDFKKSMDYYKGIKVNGEATAK